jgi:hypothetical protein
LNAGDELIDLGHTTEITSLQQSGDRVLSLSAYARWVLWDRVAGTLIAHGESPIYGAQLAGSTLMVNTGLALEIRSAVDGQLLYSRTNQYSSGVTSDGLYAWTNCCDALTVWDLLGQTVLQAPGNYSGAKIVGSDGELRVALSPSHPNAIEIFDLSSGSMAVTPPYSGTFHSWFLDGQRFLTHVSNTVWVYSKTASQLEIVTLPSISSLTGQSDYFWTYDQVFVDIYRVGGSPTPVATYNLGCCATAIGSGSKLGILPAGIARFDIVSLDPSGVTTTSHEVPMAELRAFGADETNWTVGNYHGAVWEGSSNQPLGCGEVWNIAGAETGIAAVATASGKILAFDLQPSGHSLVGSLYFPSSQVELSSEGNVLGAMGNTLDAQYWPDRSVKIFALPELIEIANWPHDWGERPNLFREFGLSGSGDHLAHLAGISTYSRMLTDVPGSITYYSDSGTNYQIYKLSPNGRRFSLFNTDSSQLFEDGALVGAVLGNAVGWLDNNRVLVNGPARPDFIKIYDSRGNLLFTSSFSAYVPAFKVVSATRIFIPNFDTILDVETGGSVWSPSRSPDGNGAVAGDFIVYTSFKHLFAERFTSADVSFQAAGDVVVGTKPFSVAAGDFNRDGMLDLAVADFDSNEVSVLLGNGDGTFQPARNFATGREPLSVAVGDFNGDGWLDLAVANSGSNDISVLLGNGDGSFQPARDFPAGSTPDWLVVGDFNGDGVPDLAATNWDSNDVSLLLGNGDGTFEAAGSFAVGRLPYALAMGDFNRDGWLDLAVANSDSNNVSVLLGNGDGTFQDARNFPAGLAPDSVGVGDFNGDGRLDLAVSNWGSNDVSVLLGNGDGSFQFPRSFWAGSIPLSVAVDDFNGDGRLDLAVTNYRSNDVLVFLGYGDGSFQPPRNFSADRAPVFIALGDFNGDGRVDLAVANQDSNDVSVLLNQARVGASQTAR